MINEKRRVNKKQIDKHLITKQNLKKTKIKKVDNIPKLPPSTDSKHSV